MTILGQEVKTVNIPFKNTYKHTWIWDGLDDKSKQLPTGIYILNLTDGQKTQMRKITIIK